jgi:sialate O-acetylesterase
MISCGMIIQRESPFPLWKERNFSAIFLGKRYEAQEINGKYRVMLDPVPAGGPFTLEIDSGEIINDIYSGDLFLCAGQSNMEMMMERIRDDFPEEWNEDFPFIRQFKVNQEWDFSAPHDFVTGGCWTQAVKETLEQFSASAWFFAKNYFKKHKVPVGLINTAWGGTPIEAWMSKEALSYFPDKFSEPGKYTDLALQKEILEKNQAEIAAWEGGEDTGGKEKWHDEKTDISSWEEVKLPGHFPLDGFCGVIWIAREFEIDGNFAGKEAKAWLGTIVDADITFLNGVNIGNMAYRYPPRKYTIPAGILKKGKNRITIRVSCNNGEGCVTAGKPFRIFSGKDCIELAGIWKYKTGAYRPERPKEFFFQRQHRGLFNAMIAPVLRYPLTAVLWYQGESNEENPQEYFKLFSLMISDWRNKNNNEHLPFLFVQLPIFGEPQDNDENSPWAVLREAQKSALAIANTGMAAALEAGEWNDLHPVDKKTIGYRLYLAAEKLLHGDNNSSPGPIAKSFTIINKRINIFFDNCAEGLVTAAGEEAVYVSVLSGTNYVRKKALIETKVSISIDISDIEKPQKIMYAWANNPRDRQLFNSDKLPALPFIFSW